MKSELKAETIVPQGCTLTLQMYPKGDVDAAIAELKGEIRKLKRALYKACANWADVVAFEETEGIGHDNSVAERWRKMESKCLKKAEEYK